MVCYIYPLNTRGQYKYVVIISFMDGKILLSRHKLRDTWETQGGHIEIGETPRQAAERELYEESGAIGYTMRSLCDYWAGDPMTGQGANGQVFLAEIEKLGAMPQSEMAETRRFDTLPHDLTYTVITQTLFAAYDALCGNSILVGTTNPAKAAYFRSLLTEVQMPVVTLQTLGIVSEPEETGNNPGENAKIKASFYGQYAKYVIAEDSGLYFDALDKNDPRQPGLRIRSPRGTRLDDEQMIAYYAELIHSLGGRTLAYYQTATAIGHSGQISLFEITRDEALTRAFYMKDAPDAERRPGWPLDSLSETLDGVSFLMPRQERKERKQNASEERFCAFLLNGIKGVKSER